MVHVPLAAILGSQGKVAVLRELWRSAVALSCQEIHRRAGMAYRTVDLSLKDLVASGVVMGAGGTHERLYRLRAEHRLVPPLEGLFRVEADFLAALRAELGAVARSGGSEVLGVSLVGSVAVGRERVGDPIRLVVVVGAPAGVKRWADRYALAGEGLRKRFGVHLEVTVYDLHTAVRMWATRTPAAEEAVAAADTVWGGELRTLLLGGGK